MNKSDVHAAVKRALMAADQEYFSWPSEKQEIFRAGMPKEVRRKIHHSLLRDILGIHCELEETDSVWNEIPLDQLYFLNWASLLTEGVGEDYIYLNEYLGDGVSILDFETLYDYDYDNYLFQEEARKKDSPDYEGDEYYAITFSRWIRLLIKDEFFYGTLNSLAGHITDELETAGHEIIDVLIPHEYVSGKDDGKRVKGGVLWDMKTDAGGYEKQLDELNRRWFLYQRERWQELNERFKGDEPSIFMKDHIWPGDSEPNKFFIFNNEEMIKKVHWKTFLSDCKPWTKAYAEVENILEQEMEMATRWLYETHQDIMENFDPDVIPFKKKRKVIVKDGTFGGLKE